MMERSIWNCLTVVNRDFPAFGSGAVSGLPVIRARPTGLRHNLVMSKVLFGIALFFNPIAFIAAAQDIPKELRGKWRVRRMLPANTISCFDDKEARKLIGTEIEYTADSFRWKDRFISHPSVNTSIVTADEFRNEFTGSYFADFRSLGIRATQATQIQIGHPAANITGGSIEIPGDEVFIKDRNTIVFAVCGTYFEGKRESAQKKASKN